jgi:uncharacterized protein (PEP-CTERM system associated)
LRTFALISLALTLLLGVPVQEALAVLAVHPRLDLREEYNDNIFLEATDEEDDFITIVTPGVALAWNARHLTLDVDYALKFIDYLDHSEEDETRLSDVQRLLAALELFPGRDFTLSLRDELTRVVVDERRPVVEENTLVNKSNLNRFQANPQYRFHPGRKVSTTLGYLYELLSYEAAEGDDAENHTGTVDLGYEYSSRLQLTLGYADWFHNAKRTEDFNKKDLVAGFSYRVGPRFTLEGAGGATWIDFEGRSENNPSAIWRGRAVYQRSEALTMELGYADNYFVSANLGLVKNREVYGRVAYSRRVVSEFRLFAREGIYQTIEREDRAAGGTISAQIPFGQRFNIGLRGHYTYYRFLPEQEDVQRYGGLGSLGYRWQWLALSLGYSWTESISDVPFNEYRNNIAFIEGQLRF